MNVIANATSSTRPTRQTGLVVERFFTKPGVDPFSQVTWGKRRSEIKSPDGKKTIFVMEDVEAPESWSQVAVDIAADKYFRKAGVPGRGHEHSIRQIVERVAKAVRQSGERQGNYFASEKDAQAFEDELKYMLVTQRGAFNSPVWFNVGLKESYGVPGKASGNFVWEQESLKVGLASDSYSRPAASACFIVSVDDDLLDIARHVEREMRIFRFGGGAGGNYSRLRGEGETLSNGGVSSGLMSFLKIFDVSAGAIKSGGTTRRAAKLVCLDADHPDIEKFVEWKVKEEEKALALIKAGYPSDFNGEAYQTVAGQNANNSVRLTDEFMDAVLDDKPWHTKWRTTGKVAATLSAKKLFRKIATAAHRCADPGLMFHSTINRWNTVSNTGQIEAANPCVEFHFLTNTACNLSSLNIMKFMTRRDPTTARDTAAKDTTRWRFDVDAFRHAARVFTLAKEIIVDYASYPTEEIAKNSHDYRPLGLGYANLGASLMIQGVPYDSTAGRAFAASVNSVLCGVAYETSAEIAASKGPFPGFAHNREPMLKVLGMHRTAAYKISDTRYQYISLEGCKAWDSACALADKSGVRNAQTTVTAPTGTIGLMMDCDTTGVEPDFSLVKSKKLAGGGFLKITNGSIDGALETLGYTENQRAELVKHVLEHGTIEGAPGIKHEDLAVFDCANRCGDGVRFIEPMGHIKMLEAVQPFVSGSISKTVNVPETTTVEEIESLYLESWKRGLKCVALYRDNSKHSQPLSSSSKKGDKKEAADALAAERAKEPVEIAVADDGVTEVVTHLPRPVAVDDRSGHGPPAVKRHRLPKRRPGGFTHELSVGGQKLYLRTGEYADGSLGELFIDMHKDGSTMRSLTNCFAVAISLGLQHGVPLREYIEAFTFMKFEPAGIVDHPNVKMASSVVDAIFRVLAVEYLGEDGFEYVQKKPSPEELEELQARRSMSLSVNMRSVMPLVGNKSSANGNGNGNGFAHSNGAPVSLRKDETKTIKRGSLTEAQTCTRCGNLTVRTGTCNTCGSCGLTTGCG